MDNSFFISAPKLILAKLKIEVKNIVSNFFG